MAGNWEDLKPRLISGALMAVVGIAAIIVGGVWFQMLAVFVTAVMVWECWIMIRGASPTSGMLLAAAVASILSAQVFGAAQDMEFRLLFLVVPLIGAALLKRERLTFFIFALAIQIAGWGLVHFRIDFGFTWLLWLVLIVVVTDIAGYVAGKSRRGPCGGGLRIADECGLDDCFPLRGDQLCRADGGYRRKRAEAAAGREGQLDPDPRPWRAV